MAIRLTEYSRGAGCGCKISPEVLTNILGESKKSLDFDQLLVGNDTRDDAAVYEIEGGKVIISTTDFFMPIVDDPFDFGGIASVNAISDIYAMGGTPLMAIAILGWPINKLSPEIAGEVMNGARDACARAGIPLAGGHSIDAPEPIFGLAVTGIAEKVHLKTNASATAGCELYLTKPLGVGILSTAQKKGLLRDEDLEVSRIQMLTLNDVGAKFCLLPSVKAMTDVTGFGLMGHLVELAEGSGLSAEITADLVPLIDALPYYIERKTFPGGTTRNFSSYGHKLGPLTDEQKAVFCDPQTSGGLLVAVDPAGREAFLRVAANAHLNLKSFGTLKEPGEYVVTIK